MRYFILATLVSITVVASANIRALGAMTGGTSDATEIVRLLLEDEKLGQYLPAPSSGPPLKLVNESALQVNPNGLGVSAQAVQAGSPEASSALVVKSIGVKGHRATLRFTYAPEGLRGTADFLYDEKSSRWSLHSIEIFET